MKISRLLTAALALGTVVAAPTFAQTTPTSTGMAEPGMASTTMNPMMVMSDMEKTKMRWVYYNLDAREMKRLQSTGLDDMSIKGAANIALRTGLSIDYVLRQIFVSGLPMNRVAAMYGLPAGVVNEDIPGMGMGMPMMQGGMMKDSMPK